MNGFDDLDETGSAGGPETSEETDDGSESMPETTADPESDSTPRTESDDLDTPAFPFGATSQEQIYPREATYDEYKAFVDFELKRDLAEAGAKDISGREIDDALLQLGLQNREEFVQLVLDARRS